MKLRPGSKQKQANFFALATPTTNNEMLEIFARRTILVIVVATISAANANRQFPIAFALREPMSKPKNTEEGIRNLPKTSALIKIDGEWIDRTKFKQHLAAKKCDLLYPKPWWTPRWLVSWIPPNHGCVHEWSDLNEGTEYISLPSGEMNKAIEARKEFKFRTTFADALEAGLTIWN